MCGSKYPNGNIGPAMYQKCGSKYPKVGVGSAGWAWRGRCMQQDPDGQSGRLVAKRMCLAGGTSEREGCSKNKQRICWIRGCLAGWASGRDRSSRRGGYLSTQYTVLQMQSGSRNQKMVVGPSRGLWVQVERGGSLMEGPQRGNTNKVSKKGKWIHRDKQRQTEVIRVCNPGS